MINAFLSQVEVCSWKTQESSKNTSKEASEAKSSRVSKALAIEKPVFRPVIEGRDAEVSTITCQALWKARYANMARREGTLNSNNYPTNFRNKLNNASSSPDSPKKSKATAKTSKPRCLEIHQKAFTANAKKTSATQSKETPRCTSNPRKLPYQKAMHPKTRRDQKNTHQEENTSKTRAGKYIPARTSSLFSNGNFTKY